MTDNEHIRKRIMEKLPFEEDFQKLKQKCQDNGVEVADEDKLRIEFFETYMQWVDDKVEETKEILKAKK